MRASTTWPQWRLLPGGRRLKRFTKSTHALQISPRRGTSSWKHCMKSVSYFFESVKRELKIVHLISYGACQLITGVLTSMILLCRYNNPPCFDKPSVYEMKTWSMWHFFEPILKVSLIIWMSNAFNSSFNLINFLFSTFEFLEFHKVCHKLSLFVCTFQLLSFPSQIVEEKEVIVPKTVVRQLCQISYQARSWISWWCWTSIVALVTVENVRCLLKNKKKMKIRSSWSLMKFFKFFSSSKNFSIFKTSW